MFKKKLFNMTQQQIITTGTPIPIQSSSASVVDYVYLESLRTGDYVTEVESGRSLEDITSRIFWNITKDPEIKGNVRILKADYIGFYDETDTDKILEMNLKRVQSKEFYYVIPLVPGYTIYSSIKKASLDIATSLSLKTLLKEIYNFYDKRIREDKRVSLTQPSTPSSTVAQVINFKTMLLSMMPLTSPYAKFIDKLLENISTGTEVRIFHEIFAFRTMFNGFLTTPNPESFTITEQNVSRVVYDYIYILNLSNSILPIENSVNFQVIFERKYLKNILRDIINEYKFEKHGEGSERYQQGRGRGRGRGSWERGSWGRGERESGGRDQDR
jgi:hypothetical protein